MSAGTWYVHDEEGIREDQRDPPSAPDWVERFGIAARSVANLQMSPEGESAFRAWAQMKGR